MKPLEEYHQGDLFEYLATLQQDDTQVEIKGAINVKSSPISEYEVRMSTGDLTLIVAVLHDYLIQIDKMLETDETPPNYHRALWEYYKDKFKKITDNISAQIGYDYEKAKEKCKKDADKKSTSTVGGDGLEMAINGMYGEKAKERGEANEQQALGN